METDEHLYNRIKSGDVAAFDVLYTRHQRGLFQFIYGYLKNRPEAEEVFHEAFMQVLKSDSKTGFGQVPEQQGTFRGWIYTVARNRCLNRLRSRKRGEDALLQYDDNYEANKEPQESSEVEMTEFAERVFVLAKTLPEPTRELFQMRRMGMAYQEISQVLGIPLGTVRSRVHAMVEALKIRLKEIK